MGWRTDSSFLELSHRRKVLAETPTMFAASQTVKNDFRFFISQDYPTLDSIAFRNMMVKFSFHDFLFMLTLSKW